VAEREAWEGGLRECLTDRASGTPLPRPDLAGAAISRARRLQRRRQVIGLVAVVGATVLATGALLQDWQGSGGADLRPATGLVGDPVTAPPTLAEPVQLAGHPALAVRLAVDLVGDAAGGGLALATGDGRTLDLEPVDEVVSAHRVGAGWAVVSGDPGTTRLWWVSPGRAPVTVLAGMDAIVVEQAQVAWRRGAMLATATLSGDGGLRDRLTTSAPDRDGQPVGFLGRTVLLASAHPAGWDIWQPERGDYLPAWNDRVVRVYGLMPDGQGAVGLVPPEPGATGPCLARLDLQRELAPTKVRCLPGELSAGGPTALSPQGQWLIATVDGTGAGAVLVDVAAAFAEQPAITELPDLPSLAGRPVWLDPDQALVSTAGSLVRVVPELLLAGAPGGVEVVARSTEHLLVVEPR
jgi:hypothetical protein